MLQNRFYTLGRLGAFAVASVALATAAGCGPAVLQVRPTLYETELTITPDTHHLSGQTTVHLARVTGQKDGQDRGVVELKLHPDLEVSETEVTGARLVSHDLRPARPPDDHPVPLPSVHRLLLEDPEQEIAVTMQYQGRLEQDVSAGEKEGAIHNFAMSAHICPEGIYLEGDSCWHPALSVPEDADPSLSAAQHRLTVEPVEGFELVASLERDDSVASDLLAWESAYPQPTITLIGGPLQRWTRQHGDVTLHAVLAADKAAVAEDVLDLCGELLDRYEPLLGEYPYREFTLLEAFFSSGFAFPGCTQIVGNRLNPYKPYRRHGYIDHEMVHSWWGCGVYVDPRAGNWCESITTYCTNYYGYVLDDDEAQARQQRRNYSNFLSGIKPENDKPLATYGMEDGAGRGLAYSKGAAVFHMLERQVGADTLFASMRRLSGQYTGEFIRWGDIQDAVEEEAGRDLNWFFDQWVFGSGAPNLRLVGADWTPGRDELKVELTQGRTAFRLDVPLRLYYGEESEDVVVQMTRNTERVTVPCRSQGLTAVELDPDYHLFRKLKPAEVMPTSSLTRGSENLVIVVPAGELWDGYQTVVDSYTRAVAGTEDDPQQGKVRVAEAAEVTEADLAEADVLVLGDAVRSPAVQALLDRTHDPVRWMESGFSVDDGSFADATEAVFFTLHHPDRPEGGVTVYYGNSAHALANAKVLSFYPNSMLVFETPEGETGGGHGHGGIHSEVVLRRDFEFHDRVEF